MKAVLGIAGIVLAVALGYWLWSTNIPPSLPGLHEETEYYTIDLVLPEHTALPSKKADERARQTMYRALAETTSQFKTDSGVDRLTPEDIEIQGLGDERKYALGAEYDEYTTTATVSYVYRLYVDTLGAHPNHFYRTFTFDEQGNEVGLADLFIAEIPYLVYLSQEAFARVTEELRIRTGGEVYPEMEETVRMGTAPSPEALQFFYLTDTDLHLLFPPYQVAAYAAGSFDIAIPLDRLQNLLKPEYR